MQDRISRIRDKLNAAFNPTELVLDDESHLHAGHAGARTGRGHFAVLIRSSRFQGKTPVQRHRLVYEALGDMMQTDIHALSIRALAPEDR
jgi:BolA protein